MKQNLTDINAYLFEQMDANSNPDLTGDELKEEIDRSKQITTVAKTIIDNGRLMLDAQKHADEYHRRPNKKLPDLLETVVMIHTKAKRPHNWLEKEDQFLINNIEGTPRKEIVEMINKEFDLDLSFGQVKTRLKKLGLKKLI